MNAAMILSLSRRRPYVFSVIVTVIAVALSILFLDRAVLINVLELQSTTRSTFNEIARLSAPEIWIPIFVVGAVLFLALDRSGIGARSGNRPFKRWGDAFLFGAASTILAGAALNVLKFIFGRLRPKAYLADGSYGFDPFSFDYSMNALPSGHTQAAVTFAIVMLFILPRYDWVYISFGLLIGACRIIHTNHWLADVIAGVWLGAVIPIALALWMTRNGRPVLLGRSSDSAVFRIGRYLFKQPAPLITADARETVVTRLQR